MIIVPSQQIITPHDYQYAARNAVFRFLDERPGENPLVCMPTGTGKSVVIADLIMQIFIRRPHYRVLMVTHVAKLIEQNAERMYQFWPTAPLGIHSSGLNQRDYMMPLIFGGVQSMIKNPHLFGHRDFIFIDECHLLGSDEDSQYLTLIKILKSINPNLIVIGFTATPYRMKMGMLTDGAIFDDICFDITDFESFNRLIREGYLCPLVGRKTRTEIHSEQLKMMAGEINQKEAEIMFGDDKVIYDGIKETVEYGLSQNRRRWMLFSAGIANAEKMAAMLQSFGIPAACVHSKLNKAENENRLRAYERDELRAIVGDQKLTTGYDNKLIDLIADFQPTASPGRHVQKGGRGTRTYRTPEWTKYDCLFLDFAKNIARNGPINDPVKPRKPGEKTGDAPIKICPQCGTYNHASVRLCQACPFEFSFETKLYSMAASDSPLKSDEKEPAKLENLEVSNVFYSKKEGKTNENLGRTTPPMVKAGYVIGLRRIDKYLCFEHTGFARKLAVDWWYMHGDGEPPNTVAEFLQVQNSLRVPKRVIVQTNLKYPDILSYEF